MSKTLLSVHWIPAHRDGRDAPFFAAWNPPYVKIVCDGDNPPYLEDVPPQSEVILRHYPASENFFQRGFAAKSPEQVAREHAETAERMAFCVNAKGYDIDRCYFEGLNEPLLWSIEPPELVARYEVARLAAMHERGLNSVVLNCGVGWPANSGPGTPVAWDWFAPVAEVMGPHDLLGLHEYWFLNGPQENWGWWGGRYTQCPFPVPIVITETGIDCGVVPGQAGSGWLRLPQAQLRDRSRAYIAQLAWYESMLLQDARIRGACVFTYDGNGSHWGGFNIKLDDWQIEFLAWLGTRPELPPRPDLPQPKPPEPPPAQPTFEAALHEAIAARQQIFLNPAAALQKHILADGFVPTCNEFDMTHDGAAYLVQRAERLSDGAVRGYYAPRGQWNDVRWA
jgi:hypothetical protein